MAIDIKLIDKHYNYYNRKSMFSISFICLVDYKMKFRSVTYGFGASHDARIYLQSSIKNEVDKLTDSGYHVLGDSAFGGFDNIYTTLSTQSQNIDSRVLYEMKKQRVVVENAFGLFKNKFKRFSGRIYKGISEKRINIEKIAFYLHNYIIDNN